MATPTAPNQAPPISNLFGARHQIVKAPGNAAFTPGHFTPVPVGAILQSGAPGTAYSETITAQGGTSPYSYAVTSGSLPTGLSLSSAGVISGTPSGTGTSTFTITVTDANGFTGSQSFQIIVASASGGGGSYVFLA